MTDALLIRDGFVYTADDADRILTRGSVLAVDGVITAVGEPSAVDEAVRALDPDTASALRVIDAGGAMVLPGFVNPHWHDMSALRATSHRARGCHDRDDEPGFLARGGNMPLISSLFDRFGGLVDELTPGEAEAIARYAIWSQLRGGVTTLGDVGSLNRPDALLAAVRALGIRGSLSTWAGDVVCRAGESRPHRTRDADEVLAAAEEVLRTCAADPSGRVRARPSAVYVTNVSDELGAGLAELAERFGTGFATHLGAQRHESDFVTSYFGLSPVRRFERFGLLSPRFMAVHCAFVDDADRPLLTDNGVHLNHSPAKYGLSGEATLSETRLLSQAIRAGRDVSLSTDGATFPLGGMVENMRAACQTHNEMYADHTVVPPTRALAMATRIAARGLQWDDQVGSLAVGKRADLVLVPVHDWRYLLNPRPLEAFLMLGGSTDVDTVIVDGQVVLDHGRSTRADERELEADYLRAVASFSARLRRVDAPQPRPTRPAGRAPDTEVLIVGAGPIGCVLALQLARQGVACTLVEQSTHATRHPKMDLISARSMELLATLGLHDELRQLGVPSDQAFNFHWTTGLDAPGVASWSSCSVDALCAQMAATNDGSVPRQAYQRVIGSRLEELGRRRCSESALIDLREGWAFDNLTQDAAGVDVQLVHVATGRREHIRARRVVACDGSGSAVRRSAGIEVDQLGPTGSHCNVYFRSADPALVRQGRFFLTISAGGVTLVSRDGNVTWTGSFPLSDDDELPADPMPLIRERLGVDFAVDEVYACARWENRLAVAREYRRGEVFLAGDAAHQYFPAGGYGANTGIGDAVDLGWKLAAVVQGWAAPQLLDSYEAERRPVALFNREMCMNLMEVWRRFMALARNGASATVLAGYLDNQSYQIRNPGVHFGYRYARSPVVWHDDGPEPAWDWQRIVATTWPGARAPSVRLRDGTEIFDLLGPGFTLVDFSGTAAGADLVEAATAYGVPITYLPIADPHVRAVWERDLVLVRPDHHVAWRGDAAPTDCAALLRHVTGHHPGDRDSIEPTQGEHDDNR